MKNSFLYLVIIALVFYVIGAMYPQIYTSAMSAIRPG